jgi:hypothetical protein
MRESAPKNQLEQGLHIVLAERNSIAVHVVRTSRNRKIGVSHGRSIILSIAQKSDLVVNVIQPNH